MMLLFLIGCLYITDEERQEWLEKNPSGSFTLPAAISSDTDIVVDAELTCVAAGTDSNTGNSLTPSFRWTIGETELGTEDTYTISANEALVGDEIVCTATIVDANGNTLQTQDSVVLENSEPVFDSEALISPSSDIRTGTELSCSASGSDANDGELTVAYEWFSDGVSLGTGETYTVSTQEVEVDAQISCIASIIDENDASQTSEVSIVVSNTEPVLSDLGLSQTEGVHNDSVLTCSANASDADEDVEIEFSWERNGGHLATGETLNLLSHEILPAQTITCIAFVVDSNGGEDSDSVSVIVENRDPVINSAFVSNQNPVADETISCSGTATDPDGENPDVTYAWEIGGSTVGTDSSLPLDPNFATVGEILTCTLTASDAYGGSTTDTATAVIQNTPPEITQATISPNAGVNTISQITCSATGTDINDGSLIPTYTWMNGSTQIGTGDTIQLDSSLALPDDIVDCTAEIIDAQGETDTSTDSVTIVNAPPQFTSSATISPNTGVYTNTELSCSATAEDPENGSLTPIFTWSLNGVNVGGGLTYTVLASETNVGDVITCEATVSDVEGETETTLANVTIENTLPSVSDTTISLSEPYNDDVVSCATTVIEPDEELTPVYTWSSGVVILHTGETFDLSSSGLLPSDDLTCTAEVTDSLGETASASTSTTIGNRIPSIPEVEITWSGTALFPEDVDDLICVGSGSVDEDGEVLVYSYEWTSDNGGSFSGGTLPASETSADETWTCMATVTDEAGGAASSDAERIVRSQEFTMYTANWLNCPSGSEYFSSDAQYKFIGEKAGDYAGGSISNVGDIDGDGLSEILIGAVGNSDAENESGKIYLFFSSSLAENSTIDLSLADYVFLGEAGLDWAGYSVTGAGDVDGDGLGDILIGAPYNDDSGDAAGQVYLILGSSLGESRTIDLSAADYSFLGENAFDRVGFDFNFVGDVDGDGLDDIFLGAYGNDDGGNNAGKAYLILGSSLGSFSTINLFDADYSFVEPDAESGTGLSISGAGDVDGDGLKDLLIGSYKNDTGEEDAGKAYIVLGASLGGDSVINLVDADYAFVGESASDWAGYAVSSAGDVDGDGLDDILIGARYNDDLGESNGKAYLILGASLGASMMPLANADYSFFGDSLGENAGREATSAGDVDGDGLDDIIISAVANSREAYEAGRVSLFLGASLGATSELNLSDADYNFFGEASTDWVGRALSPAGDINGDGLDDILIGASANADAGTAAGKILLFTGCSPNTAPTQPEIVLSGLNSNQDLVCEITNGSTDAEGQSINYSFFWQLNGETYFNATTTNHTGDTVPNADMSAGDIWSCSVQASDGFMSSQPVEISQEMDAYNIIGDKPSRISSAGDVDGDGLEDIFIVNPENDDGGENAGQVYLFLGSSLGNSSEIDVSSADYSFIGEAVGDNAGWAVSSAGDVDGDGLSDILIGAAYNDEAGSAAGKIYLVFGSSLASSGPEFDLSTADYYFRGENENDYLGAGVSSAGDIDDDGLDDILLGASYNDDGGLNAGKVYLILASSLGSSVEFDITGADYSFVGEGDYDYLGRVFSSSGDVDGDGINDILLGVPWNNESKTNSGKVYLILSSSLMNSSSSTFDLSLADYTFLGENAEDLAGQSIDFIEDLDGDGLDDIVMGAAQNDEGGTHAGKVYVILSSDLSSSTISLSNASYEFIGEGTYNYLGYSLDVVGDVDGDGLSDILIGASWNDDGGTQAGKVYFISGSSLGSSSSMDLSSADYSWNGESGYDHFGYRISSADINGDGVKEFLFTAPDRLAQGSSIDGVCYIRGLP